VLIELLKKGGFRFRKWASNATDLLSDLDSADHGLATHKDNEYIKILKVIWNSKLDIFQFRVTVPSLSEKTKQAILSTIAKFFDPSRIEAHYYCKNINVATVVSSMPVG